MNPEQRSTYVHVRPKDDDGNPKPRGGITVYYRPFNNKAILAVAVCSKKDNFCKERGRLIAKGRADNLAESLGYSGELKSLIDSPYVKIIEQDKIKNVINSEVFDNLTFEGQT
ncbi:MAG: hypothetical protein ACOC80_09030 [Petrotogales bacterium]